MVSPSVTLKDALCLIWLIGLVVHKCSKLMLYLMIVLFGLYKYEHKASEDLLIFKFNQIS